MKHANTALLDKAVDITKAYASSGGGTLLDTVLRMVYEELKKINEEQ